MNMRSLVVLGSACLLSAAASADELKAKSYDMLNGETGSFTYWDDSYNGSGNPTQSGSALSGGLGDLTDGVIAEFNWFSTPGPYVGWNTITPTITFHFDSLCTFNNIALYLDDSNGNGGVAPPSVVRIKIGDNAAVDFPVTDPDSGTPFAFIADTGGAQGDTVEVTLFDGRAQWVFLSEVKFNGAIPAPGAAALLGLAGLGLRRHR